MKGIPYALLTLGALTSFVVFWALNQTWIHTFGAFFTWLGKLGIDFDLPVGGHVGVHPFGKLLDLNNSIQTFLSTHVASTEHAMVRLFHQTVAAFGAFALELGSLAESVERRFTNLVGATIPRLVRAALGGVLALVRKVPALVARVDHLLGYVERKIKAGIAQAIAFAYRQLKHAGKYAAGLATNAFKSVKNFGLRLLHLERKLLGKQLRDLIHGALSSMGLGWLWSIANNKWARWLMRHPVEAVNEFVNDALKILGFTDLCTLAQFNLDVAIYVFEPLMRELIGLENWFCSTKNETLASAMDVKPEYKLAWAPSATPTIDFTILPERKAPHIPLPRGVVKA